MFPPKIYVVAKRLLIVALFATPMAVFGTPHKYADSLTRKWTLVWRDEFDGPDGSMPDPNKWSIVRSGSGFGNQELQYYTNQPSNLHIEGGMLAITARKETFKGEDGIARDYTSARLETTGHFQQKYG